MRSDPLTKHSVRIAGHATSVSLESALLEEFDRYCREGRFATRSEAIRQLLHEKLTDSAWELDSQDAAATLTLVYDQTVADGLLNIAGTAAKAIGSRPTSLIVIYSYGDFRAATVTQVRMRRIV